MSTAGTSQPVWLPAPADAEAADAVIRTFRAAFGTDPVGVWSAPGRVNLIGEHVDYNGGWCLPLALPHRTRVAARPRADGRVRLLSRQEEQRWEGTLVDVGPGRPRGWPAYAAGVLWALSERGLAVPGVDLVVDGAVPLGAGLSSSAALECAVALAAASLAEKPDASTELLHRACVRAENEVAGAPTGGMDQAVALGGRAGHALLLDVGRGTSRPVPLDLVRHELALLVIDTRTPHRLTDGQYAQRRRTCEEAAAALGVSHLAQLHASTDLSGLDPIAGRRVRHVLTELARVTAAVTALERGRPADLGPLLLASHASLREDYEVSSPELDLAVTAAVGAGAAGARMTGGGFGGSAVALAPRGALAEVAAAVHAAFTAAGMRAPRFLEALPGAGARRDR
ncbi:galactokinase [Ornithinicoccus halotolerans]|uniref:galactokinase n=1 Tax=Ornithinicoccus halotolerans TaxID=1748220 RepID=UPI0012965EA1|nr:galactokinase [Ornithinicoccus halotolerans]